MQPNTLAYRISMVSKMDSFWELMVNESAFKSGPFDGGCLTCARAIIAVEPKGDLVRIVSRDTGVTQHYGVLVHSVVYDFNGLHKSTTEWLSEFAANESLDATSLNILIGFDTSSEIVDDLITADKISLMLKQK
jgi:hypothetical protein